MARIEKVKLINGKKVNLDQFKGLHVADVDLLRLDVVRYYQSYKGREEVNIDIDYTHTDQLGGWDHQDEVETI